MSIESGNIVEKSVEKEKSELSKIRERQIIIHEAIKALESQKVVVPKELMDATEKLNEEAEKLSENPENVDKFMDQMIEEHEAEIKNIVWGIINDKFRTDELWATDVKVEMGKIIIEADETKFPLLGIAKSKIGKIKEMLAEEIENKLGHELELSSESGNRKFSMTPGFGIPIPVNTFRHRIEIKF